MNLKLAVSAVATTLSVSGGVTAYFLISNQQSAKTSSSNSFKKRFPKLQLLPGNNLHADLNVWRDKINLLKIRYNENNGEDYKNRLSNSMVEQGIDENLVNNYIRVVVSSSILENETEAKILATYCGKVWVSESKKTVGVEDIVKEICSNPIN